MRSWVATLVVACVVTVGAAATPASHAQSSSPVPVPTVEEIPPDAGIHGHPLWDPWFDVSAFGYETHEYLVSGTATATDSDATAAYTTRIVVNRPSDPAAFSGTVLLDWVNVTAQFENAVNTLASIEFLLREGWAFVHVSAQAAGVCCTPLTPQVFDPVRYAALAHPGDEYANDMFSQVAQALRAPGPVQPMGGLDVEVLIAAGQSQGGSRLSDYIATTAAAHGVIDAVLQQAGGSKTYEVAPSVPVIHLLGDREGTPGEPTPWPTYRLWEVASSAHQDSWVGRQQTEGQSLRLATGSQLSREEAESLWASAGNYGEQVDPRSTVCVVNGALFPTRYVGNAALAALDRWVRDGVRAPQAPRYEFDGDTLATDGVGNTLGGLRLPPADVPVARYEADTCNLGGITIPFTEAELLAEYGDHATYYGRMVEATRIAMASGYLLRDDAVDLLTRACTASNRFLQPDAACEPSPATALDDGAAPTPAPGPDPGAPTDPTPGPAPPPTGAGDLPATGTGFGMLALLMAIAGAPRVAARG